MREVFPIIPASGAAPWILLGVVGVVTLAALLAVGASVLGSRTARFEVTETALRLKGDLYGRTIPLSDLTVSEARVVDLDIQTSLRPSRRTFGTALPGYASGWFRLRDGQKALLYLTDRRRVAYLPTRRGHAILLSVAEPQAFIEALRAAGGQ